MFSGRRRSGVHSSLYTGMPGVSVSPNTISLSSDCSVVTVDTFITNISSVSTARAVTDSVTGQSKNSECSPLGKSVSLPARAVTDSVTGRSKISECSLLGKSVSLPARAVTDSVTGRSKNGREDIDWLLDDIAEDGYGPPAVGKRRLIQREGFVSRISKYARPHDPGGGGTTRSPDHQNARKMIIRKLPMDIVENRNVKPIQVSSQVAEKASSDGTTNKQCRAVHRQSSRTTVTEMHTNFAGNPKPTLSQRPAVAAEEAGTDGTVNVQCLSNYHDYMKTTMMKLRTDFVKLTELTLSRVSPVVAKEAHTDGTRVVQYQSDDQNSMKTTIMQIPMDYLEIPEPSLLRGFLEPTEEARNVNVESGQSCYTEEVQ